MFTDHLKQAQAILRANDRGGYTVPSSRLYPFQWNWDSALIALGLATFDRERAFTEIEFLLKGQWQDGMIPHIIFHQPDAGYFPGPEVWGTQTQPPSSGITQPPLLASVVWKLLEGYEAELAKRGPALFDRLYRYHQWFHQQRDPYDTGLCAIIHPWESGRDNSPDWDEALTRISVDELPPYKRRDTEQVASHQRPTDYQYDRYLSLLHYGNSCQWRQKTLYSRGEFLMLDPGVIFILRRADQDLQRLGQALQAQGLLEPDDARMSQLHSWVERGDMACRMGLWFDRASAYCAFDLRRHIYSPAISSSALLCFYAGESLDSMQGERSMQSAELISRLCIYTFPSFYSESNAYDPWCYWRGPSWPHINYLIYDGFRAVGADALAERVRQDTLKMIRYSGFYEYYNPHNGKGLGGPDFSWTAAVYTLFA